MPQIEHNGPGFFYRVLFRPYIWSSNWLKEDINDWKQTSFAFYTPSSTAYMVEAHNSLGTQSTHKRFICVYLNASLLELTIT